jgi:hypothetical protein
LCGAACEAGCGRWGCPNCHGEGLEINKNNACIRKRLELTYLQGKEIDVNASQFSEYVSSKFPGHEYTPTPLNRNVVARASEDSVRIARQMRKDGWAAYAYKGVVSVFFKEDE